MPVFRGMILAEAVLCLALLLIAQSCAEPLTTRCLSDTHCKSRVAPYCLRIFGMRTGRCVGCRTSSQCTKRDLPRCGECHYCQVPLPGFKCSSNTDCFTRTPLCDVSDGVCKGCLADSDCYRLGGEKLVCGKCGVCEVPSMPWLLRTEEENE